MQTYLNTILKITAEAEKIPKQYFRQGVEIDNKSDDSPVTVADRKTEAFIRAGIAQHFPDHSIFGEEFAQVDNESAYRWIIDPIDGTRSFISGMPLYGMLIALLQDGDPVLGMVRMPELGEVYTGTADGAFLNGDTRLHTSETTALAKSILYINEGEKLLAEVPETFANLCKSGREHRLSYDCYPHALLAAGHIDACVDYDLKPFDFLPLVAIIEAAGGVITDWQGGKLGMQSGGRVVSAATKELHRELLEILN
ncbi:MAG: inositol monophosphatase family protein [Rhodobacteraceae bacterium]|nr:inositol monophosphatase family protein [Paracoccaceae bacterium]